MKRCAKTCVVVGLLAASNASLAQVAGTLLETPKTSIGYESVAAALKAVQAKPGIETRVENGWFVVVDNAARTIWSFAPQGHPAYPTAVQRTVVPISMAARAGDIGDDHSLRRADGAGSGADDQQLLPHAAEVALYPP
jgi:hypothetical protein